MGDVSQLTPASASCAYRATAAPRSSGHAAATMAAGPVLVYPKARAAPLAVRTASSTKTSACGCRAQRRSLQVESFQRRQRDESRRTGHGGYDESMQAGQDRAGEHLPEQTWFAFIRSLQRAEVPCPVPLVDDGGRVAKPNQDEIEDQASGAAVAVDIFCRVERMVMLPNISRAC